MGPKLFKHKKKTHKAKLTGFDDNNDSDEDKPINHAQPAPGTVVVKGQFL